jgi:hypothetical protein
LSLLFDINYNTFSFNEEEFIADLGFSGYGIQMNGANASVLTISMGFKSYVVEKINKNRPYICVGVGYFRKSVNDVNFSWLGTTETFEGGNDEDLAVSLGAGIEFMINENTAFFLETKYALGFSENEDMIIIPLKIGIKFK